MKNDELWCEDRNLLVMDKAERKEAYADLSPEDRDELIEGAIELIERVTARNAILSAKVEK